MLAHILKLLFICFLWEICPSHSFVFSLTPILVGVCGVVYLMRNCAEKTIVQL